MAWVSKQRAEIPTPAEIAERAAAIRAEKEAKLRGRARETVRPVKVYSMKPLNGRVYRKSGEQ